jgi:hypothetical protein
VLLSVFLLILGLHDIWFNNSQIILIYVGRNGKVGEVFYNKGQHQRKNTTFHFFFFIFSTGVWTQDLHLEPLHQSFFCDGFFFWDRVSQNYFPGLASSHDPPDLCLLSS